MVEETSNKTIAKNTIFLYIRSFLVMAIGLYSSRVVLQTLGVEDYGLYGAIGSIVAMFTMINGILATGTSRFLTFELGKGDKERLRKTFSASFAMHVCLAIMLLVLLETIGLWFVNNKMNIPEGRGFAANAVYQLSIITCMLTLTQVPYSASIIAHEKMGVYAYVGIAEVTFKLALIFALLYVPFSDNLIAYAIILTVWSIGLQIWYRFYCRKKFEESNLMIVRDKSIYKGMLTYSMWDFIGQFCATGNNQGTNILINLFFGVSINAGRAVAYQVENAITTFSTNFMMSVQPQLVKSFARNEIHRFITLITESGKYSFYLLFIVSLPIWLEADYVLTLWLGTVPPVSIYFLRLVMITKVIRTFATPVIQGVHATGDVKFLNITTGLYSILFCLPVIYLFYSLGFPAWISNVVTMFNAMLCNIFELFALKKHVEFSIVTYFKKIYVPVTLLCLLGSLPAIVAHLTLPFGFLRFWTVAVLSVLCVIGVIYRWGISNDIRYKINKIILSKIKRG